MPTPFRHTLRSLEADGLRGWSARVVLVALFLGLWAAWFALARVSVNVATAAARLEAERDVHSLQAPVPGRITVVAAEIEQEVRRDDVLFELDASAELRRLAEETVRLESLAGELAALESKLEVETRAYGESRRASDAEIEETKARYEESVAAQRFAEQELERLTRLFGDGLVSESALERARTDAEQRRAAAEALRSSLERMGWSHRTGSSDRLSGLDELRREIASLEGRKAAAEVAVSRLQHEVDLRKIRAPVDGRIAQLAPIEVGSFVEEGERFGAIVPPGDFKVVADFLPADALGRIAGGQPARFRLEGFPSIQYGSLPARVLRVSSELRDGRIRVELSVDPAGAPDLPLQHGLPGTAEVEVERVAPAILVLRAAGKVLRRGAAAEAAGDGGGSLR